MAIVKSKGTALLMEIASVYTAVPQLKSLTITGAASETFEEKTLDLSTAYIKKHANGYTAPAVITAEIFRDPDNAVHAAIIAKLATPAENNFKVTYADDTPLSEIYAVVGYGFDTTASPEDGLSATITLETSGAPS